MIHTFFYQTVCLEQEKECKTTYRKSVSTLPHIPDAVFDEFSPKAGFEVTEVRFDLDRCEMHVVLENRVMNDAPIECDMFMQQNGWQRAPRDARYCVEVELNLKAFPSAGYNQDKHKRK